MTPTLTTTPTTTAAQHSCIFELNARNSTFGANYMHSFRTHSSVRRCEQRWICEQWWRRNDKRSAQVTKTNFNSLQLQHKKRALHYSFTTHCITLCTLHIAQRCARRIAQLIARCMNAALAPEHRWLSPKASRACCMHNCAQLCITVHNCRARHIIAKHFKSN